MARDQAYYAAEKKIEEARRSGARELDLSQRYDAKDSDKLTELPESLGQLTQLQSLNLSGNQLTTLPESLGQLSRLQSLNLFNNKLMAVPESFGQLTQLRSLDLAVNQLTALPKSLGQLRQLRILDLFNNQLTALPEWLGQLTQLESLYLSNNQLTALPESLAQLEHLEKLNLDKNPLNLELSEAYAQGLESVKAYLRAKAGAQIILNEAKLILVGEGEVGKTCLMDALLGKEWQEHPSTHGIEIQQVKVTDAKTKKEITLNGWDFGGQRVYRPTHQLFFSAPAVYLVVWKPREGPQQGFVKEWIQLIKRREPSAKIIVVATHGGPQQRQPDIDRQELLDLFGGETIVDFFFVDSKPDENGERKNIEELKQAIARVAVTLPEVGRSVPKSFQDARLALQAKGVPYLPFDDVLTLCRAQNMDDEIARLFITISHRLGHLTHYANDPALRDIVILRPDWLATAMSFVFDDENTRHNHGLVSFHRLGQLWNHRTRAPEFRYPSDLHPIFLRLMERFDLSYRLADPSAKDDSNPLSLIAQLVPDNRPENMEGAWSPAPSTGDLQQTQICRIVDKQTGQSATAEGLFYQLIVRLHRYSLGHNNYNDSVHWQRGLVVDNAYNGRAFLEHKGNDVHITVRAPYPQGLLTMLTSEVKYLVESFWEGLRCDVMVPCITPCGKETVGTGLYEVEKLIDSKRKGRPDFPCPVCTEWQNIDQLLRNAPAAQPFAAQVILTEFAEVKRGLAVIYKKMLQQHAETQESFTALDANDQKLLSQIDASFTGLLRALSDEAKEGPRLFSLIPVERDRFDPKNWVSARFRLTLWCEHSRVPLPRLNHGSPDGVYEFDVKREWLKEYAPFLKALTITLRTLLPVAFSAAQLLTNEAIYKAVENELDFSQACMDAMLTGSEDLGKLFTEDLTLEKSDVSLARGRPEAAHGAALREFHALLNKLDPKKRFGGLVRVTNKRQEFLWVHPQYAEEY